MPPFLSKSTTEAAEHHTSLPAMPIPQVEGVQGEKMYDPFWYGKRPISGRDHSLL